ncbi:sulfotransferase family 2 domain-containing protein [Cyanobium sp. HWJ4-Hawea]|uniref:sulfotransferase family 2 domain-containing protein n=1 Tax=Cyanobium sp. HWJ4-Hawea TaxID=2823713 RepID=UPI0020CFBCBF|nr:sulfotransferase family 2 domain-containing protein [Cyanobium sp. HWJ4-Hawea]MCP9808640.1 sulfotransferase family 2 domain-containing protein [Cyanobium sp. HWJ4-Hawea]
MPCTPDRQLLFLHIPKVGGTSIERALGMFGDWQVEDQGSLFGLVQSPELLAHGWGSAFLQHLSWREIQQHWDFSDALRFAVVRSPWARFASVYTNTDTHLCQTARQMGIELEGLSFSAFVAATEGLSHAHLRPQLDFICDASGELVVEELLRTESLSQDYASFAAAHGLPTGLPWENRSSQQYRMAELYDRKNWQRIGERYRADVIRLGYGDTPEPW